MISHPSLLYVLLGLALLVFPINYLGNMMSAASVRKNAPKLKKRKKMAVKWKLKGIALEEMAELTGLSPEEI